MCPAQDLYIEKDSSINEEIERLRHAATAALFGRRDTIVVASVSCIFGLGSPGEVRRDDAAAASRGEMLDRDATLRKLVDIQYSRNDQALGRGTFRVRGRHAGGLPRLRRDRLPRGALRRRGRGPPGVRPAHRRGAEGPRARRRLAGHPLRHRQGHDRAGGGRDPRRAGDAHQGARGRGQAAGVTPPPPAHPVRHGDAARARLLQRDRELLAHPRRPPAGRAPVLPRGLLPRRLRVLHRRVAPDRAPDRRHVRGRPLAQADAGRARLPAAERAGQPARRPSTSSCRSCRR